MTMPNTPMLVSKDTQARIIQFHKECFNLLNQQWNLREQMRLIDLAYIREQDWTTENIKARLSNSLNDADKFQNITLPVVMPQVESATVYQSSVFLTGIPIFGVVSSPVYEDQAMQLETVIDENATRGKWKRELMKSFRDGFKYNISCVEVTWGRRVTAALESDVTFANGKQGKPKEVLWEGNILTRMDMYNTFFDSRVAPTEIHEKGEFAGYTDLMSRIALKKFLQELPDKMISNVIPAFESGMGASTIGGNGIESYYIPNLNPDAILNKDVRATTNWLAWAGMDSGNGSKIQYKNMYEVTTMYARIIPADFGLKVPSANTPQVWKFIIVNHQVLIYAERQTNAHNFIPMLFSQPLEDGLTYQTKSLATNVLPMQQVGTALMNGVVAARRRAISDRGLFDPSRVTEANINSKNPSAKIPVRPAAYGKPLNEAYYPIPFQDDQSPIMMQQIGALTNFANQISGQNPVKQGQFVKGNKTQSEFEDVMSHANGRDQLTSILIEDQLMTPLKEILKTNTLQYQGGVSYYNRVKNQDVEVDPVALRQAVINFKMSDGLTPTDKLINKDIMMVAMQTLASSEQLGAQYNLGPLFSYLMKTQNAHLKEFEKPPEQIAYEQAVSQWQQTVMELVKQNPAITPDKYPPQPTPQQFKYNPQGLNPTPQTPQQGQPQ